MVGKGISYKQKKADKIDLRAKKITRYRENHNNKSVNPPGRLSNQSHSWAFIIFIEIKNDGIFLYLNCNDSYMNYTCDKNSIELYTHVIPISVFWVY